MMDLATLKQKFNSLDVNNLGTSIVSGFFASGAEGILKGIFTLIMIASSAMTLINSRRKDQLANELTMLEIESKRLDNKKKQEDLTKDDE